MLNKTHQYRDPNAQHPSPHRTTRTLCTASMCTSGPRRTPTRPPTHPALSRTSISGSDSRSRRYATLPPAHASSTHLPSFPDERRTRGVLQKRRRYHLRSDWRVILRVRIHSSPQPHGLTPLILASTASEPHPTLPQQNNPLDLSAPTLLLHLWHGHASPP